MDETSDGARRRPGKISDETNVREASRFDVPKGDGSRAVSVRLLHAARGRGTLPRSLRLSVVVGGSKKRRENISTKPPAFLNA